MLLVPCEHVVEHGTGFRLHREAGVAALPSALCGCAPDTGQEAYGRGKEDSRVGRRYAGGRLDRRGAMLMSVSAALRFWFAGVDRQSAGLLR